MTWYWLLLLSIRLRVQHFYMAIPIADSSLNVCDVCIGRDELVNEMFTGNRFLYNGL